MTANKDPWPVVSQTCDGCRGSGESDFGHTDDQRCEVCAGAGYVTFAAGMGLYSDLSNSFGCRDLAARMHRAALALEQLERANRKAKHHHLADLSAVERVTLLVCSRVLVILADRAASNMPAPRLAGKQMPRPPLWRRVVRWVMGRKAS